MKFKEGLISLDKELNELDRFVIDFVELLENHEYVVVSGYVSILFGRSRGSEDIDLLLAELSEEEFSVLFNKLIERFDCINCGVDKAYSSIAQGMALRFARKGQVIPNMEVKFGKSAAGLAALHGKIKVQVQEKLLFISPIELQIVYKKLCLKSDKDVEDARHLEILFKDKLSREKLNNYEFLINEHGC